MEQIIQIKISVEELKAMLSKTIDEKLNTLRKEENTKDLPEWMTQKEVAKYFGVSRGTVLKWEKEKKLTRKLIDTIPKFSKKEVLGLIK